MSIRTSRRAFVGAGVAWAVSLPVAACGASAPTATLHSGNFPSIADAVAAWAAAGGTLVINRDHELDHPIIMTCVPGRSYHLTSDAPRVIRYTGSHYHWMFCIYSKGDTPFTIDGELTFDGADNCNIPFYALFEKVSGAARRDFSVSGLTGRNARMKNGRNAIDGSPNNSYGARGLLFSGGFDHLTLRNVRALNVSREAGSGKPEGQGCVGIGVIAVLPTTSSAKHVLIEDFEVTAVDSDEPLGSPLRENMDGLSVFQSAEADGSRPIIQRGVIREAAGRAIKVFAPGGGGAIRQLTIYRSVHGKKAGSNDVANLHGDGLIEDITLHYSGQAHSLPTIPIAMSSEFKRASGFEFGTAVIRNITIKDSTGRTKRAVVSLYYNQQDASPRRFNIKDVTDEGRAEIFLLPGSLGLYGPVDIDIVGASVDLTSAFLASENPSRQLRVTVRGFDNRAPRMVPFQVRYDGTPTMPGFGGRWLPDVTSRGVTD